MTKFANKTFTVAVGSDKYRANYDRVFKPSAGRKKRKSQRNCFDYVQTGAVHTVTSDVVRLRVK